MRRDLDRSSRADRARGPLFRLEALEPRVMLSHVEVVPHPLLRHAEVAAPAAKPATAGWAVSGVVGVKDLARSKLTIKPPVPASGIENLPDEESTEVASTLEDDVPAHIYLVPVQATTRTVRVDVQIGEGETQNERLWLMDGEGNVIGHWPLPTGGGVLSVELESNGAATDLLVGIAYDSFDPQVPDGTSHPFLLTIGRAGVSSSPVHSTSDFAPGIGDPTSSAASSSPVSAAIFTSQGVASQVVGTDSDPAFPLRGAGPVAGVPSDLRTIPAIRPADLSYLDLTMVDLYGDPPARATGDGGDSRSSSHDDPVVDRENKAFPLLGSALIASPKQSETDVWVPVMASLAVSPASQDAPIRLKTGTADPPVPQQRGTRRRMSPGLGLGLSAALAFGLLLPDLVARFTVPPPKRRLPWDQTAKRTD